MSVGLHPDSEKDRILLGLLELVERDGAKSQRYIAGELGVALGLVNAYLSRCVKKGLVKIKAVPARRYVYFLTPQGFAEKSRLTIDYLSTSFSFFRQARQDCSTVLRCASQRGCRTVALLGISDLAEIAIICAMETGLTVGAIVANSSSEKRYLGIPIVASVKAICDKVDAVIVTDLQKTQSVAEAAIEVMGEERVLIPALLNIKLSKINRTKP
jgi:DNA-binding MarR family transcriptional regulator